MLNSNGKVVPFSRWSAELGKIFAGRHGVVAIRLITVLAALAIFYMRTPSTFNNPQFWGEDIDFFYDARTYGWPSLSTIMAGYLVVAQFLVAILTSYFNPLAAPAIYNYSAVVLTLLVVWLVTSPRLDLPNKPLLAIAVVIVPMGFEELGTITNIQWILPLGAFAILFMRRSPSVAALCGETLFIAVTSVSGPFSIFLTPLFLWRCVAARNANERRRLVLLTAAVSAGGLIQAAMIITHPGNLDGILPAPYSWTLWVNLPLSHMLTTFGPVANSFEGTTGVVLGALGLTAAGGLALRGPYRTQKLFMLLFAAAIAVSGMYKYRAALESQLPAQRYFYAGSVFSLWFICCLSKRKSVTALLGIAVALAELMLLPVIARTPRIVDDLSWPTWGAYISSGLPVILPSSPGGFYLGLPATPTGPLARFASWTGQDIKKLAGSIDPTACKGALGLIRPLDIVHLKFNDNPQSKPGPWTTRGTAWDNAKNRPVQLVALADAEGRVLGFGFPGFRRPDEMTAAPELSGWISSFNADPGRIIYAYGILDDGMRVCPLTNGRYFPIIARPLASSKMLEVAEVAAGNDVVQRFKPIQRLEGMSLRFVTWGRAPSRYTVDWKIVATRDGQSFELGNGRIDAGKMRDWQTVDLPITVFPEQVPDQIEVVIHASAEGAVSAPIGLPLYQPLPDTDAPPAEVGGRPTSTGAQLSVIPAYGG